MLAPTGRVITAFVSARTVKRSTARSMSSRGVQASTTKMRMPRLSPNAGEADDFNRLSSSLV